MLRSRLSHPSGHSHHNQGVHSGQGSQTHLRRSGNEHGEGGRQRYHIDIRSPYTRGHDLPRPSDEGGYAYVGGPLVWREAQRSVLRSPSILKHLSSTCTVVHVQNNAVFISFPLAATFPAKLLPNGEYTFTMSVPLAYPNASVISLVTQSYR